MLWFSADFHYHHKNIVKGTSNWKDKSGCRDFDTIEEHNQTLVNNINEFVKPNDTLWFLGDWAFGGKDKRWKFRKQLNVKEIHLILGNHDHHIEANKWLHIPRTNVDMEILQKNNYGYEFFRNKNDEWQAQIKAQNLFSSVSHYKEVKVEGHRIILSHYAFDVWNYRHKGAFHLFGHSHNNLPDRGDRRLDVGVESAYECLGEWRPFSFKEIQKILQPRSYKPLDHHNKDQNE